MISRELRDRVIEISEEIAVQEGMELVDVEILGAPGRFIVRVYIDKEGGVSVSDCASFSRYLGTVLEVDDPIPSSYFLEVSSPGVDRILRKPAHFSLFKGRRVSIKLEKSWEGRKKITGTICGVHDSHVEVESEGKRFRVEYDNIRTARLKLTFGEWEKEVEQ